MNYGISVLFRAIPLLMAFVCFAFGLFIFLHGDAPARLTAGPVVFFLGAICIALFATAATIIRQLIHTYKPVFKFLLPLLGYSAALFTVGFGIWMFTAHGDMTPVFVSGHVVSGIGLIAMCVSTAATSSVNFTLIPQNSKKTDNTPNPQAYSRTMALTLETIVILASVTAWIWAVVLLARHDDQGSLVAGTVMGGLAAICTSLVALVASISRQTRNTYKDTDKRNWPRLVLFMGTAVFIWGLLVVLLNLGTGYGPIGYILMGLGLVCYSISSKVILLAKVWRGEYPLAKRIPLIPVMTALTALFISVFLFEESIGATAFFTPARVLAGLGAVCFTLFSIVSVLESGTSSK